MPGPPPRDVSSRSASRSRARRSLSTPAWRASAISLSAARGGHPQAALDLTDGLSLLEPHRRCPRLGAAAEPSSRSARARAPPGPEAPDTAAPPPAASPATTASASAHTLRSPEAAVSCSTSSTVNRRPGPTSSASFSSSRWRRCWRSPTCWTSARAASGSSSISSSRDRLRDPPRQLPRLDAPLRLHVTAGRADGILQRGRH